MKKFLLALAFPVICYGQGDQTIIKVPINASGSTFQAILHLPNDYGTTTTAYPLLIFLHGLGEGGANPASIYTSSSAGGPAYYIAQGTFPASFVNPKDGKSYKYIVVSPQANPQGVEGSTTAQELDYVLTYLYAHYRVDQSRVYLTGLSDGGESVLEYIGGEMGFGGSLTKFSPTHAIAAIVPMSENGSALLLQSEAASIVSGNIGAWGFGSTDEQGQNTLSIAWYANVLKAGSMITTSYSGGHCCWGQFYNPGFTQSGMSIYQWLLQFQHGASTGGAAVTTPEPNAGAAQTVQLPTSQTTLNGAASTVENGTIAGWAWVQQSGPSNSVIASPKSESTAVSGLVAGVYVFKLTITDNTGKTGSATVQVSVNAAGKALVTGLSIPGTISASNYDASVGVMTQVTSDVGGGLNVGWIDQGDWMDYKVNVAAAGTYTVSFRIATASSGASFQLRTGAGVSLATIQVPNTGGYQIWKTVTATVKLAAGSQVIQLYSTSAAVWNINWMQFSTGTQGTEAVAGEAFTSDSSLVASGGTGTDVLLLYPNPAKSSFTVQVNNALSGNMLIQVIDAMGRVRGMQSLQKEQPVVQVDMSAESLSAGIYFVRVQMGAWSEVRKLMKY